MKKRLSNHIKNLLLPCLFLSMATGFFSALTVTLFKLLAEWAVRLCATVYGVVRERPVLLPLLILGAAAIGFIARQALHHSHSCRGGGIPTSIAAIRGIVSFKWVASLTILPFSALLSFLAGLPLGTEGPCVQMGTAVGDGVSELIGGKKHRAWRRYTMTGGACAGFSLATASPITAIFFAMEELHKHYSPLLLTVAAVSVTTAQLTARALCALGIGSIGLFEAHEMASLPLSLLYAPLLIGVVAGVCSILFTKLYHLIDRGVHFILARASTKLIFPVLFASAALVGFFLSDALGTGHSLIESLLEARVAWYILILVFIVRAIGMMTSNTAGATGGVFLPTLAFGAMIGAVCGEAMLGLSLIGQEQYPLMVVLGITAFLGATSRIPLTACVFAVEALGGIGNILPLIITTTVALLVTEASGLEDFTDTMIDAKIKKISRGKTPTVVETSLRVGHGSFAVGKEIRDLLWPNSCVVVSYERAEQNHSAQGIAPSDIITVRYSTYDKEATISELEALVGEQER